MSETAATVEEVLLRHEGELAALRSTVLALKLEVADAVKPVLLEHTERLDDHAKQLAALRSVPARLDSIWMRLDRLEQGQEDTAKGLRDVSIALSAVGAELQASRAEARTGLEVVKDLIIEKVAPRGPSDAEARIVGLTALLAAAERERDDLRALVRDRP